METRKIVVVVEDVEAARTALQWALHNLLRYGDIITLLHVFPSTRSKNKNKLRLLRLKGFQLALSFKDACSSFPNTKVEIVVSEGDQIGSKIAAVVREIDASMLVIGLHDRSFLYKLALAHSDLSSNFSCRVLAIKQPQSLMQQTISTPDRSTNMDFSQIEITKLSVPYVPPPKIPYRIFPSPSAIIWRPKRKRRKESS